MKQRILIGLAALLVVVAQLSAGATTASAHHVYSKAAWCSNWNNNVSGVPVCTGYFNDAVASGGTGANLISGGLWVMNIDDFVTEVRNHATGGTTTRNQLGAGMLVSEMMGWYGTNLATVTNNNHLDQWEERVRAYDSAGYVDFSVNDNATAWNSAWAGDIGNPVYHAEMHVGKPIMTIVFDAPGPGGVFKIQKDCGNLMGDGTLPDVANYELTPNIATQPDDFVETGQEVEINASVTNSGPTASNDTQWEVHRFVFPPGVNHTDPAAGTSGSDACSYADYNPGVCTFVKGDTQAFAVSVVPTPVVPSIDNYIVPFSYDVGTKICFSLSIKPWQKKPNITTGSDWRHSDLACVTVAKKPKFHVKGGDLRVGGSITTSISKNIHSTLSLSSTAKTYGSWVEYGVLSESANKLMSSGSGLRAGHTSSNPTNWSELTFSNTPNYGGFMVPQLVTSASHFDSLDDVGSIDSALSATGKNVDHVGDFTINPTSIINVGDSYIIVSSGTVTIKSDITYSSGSISSIEDIPQVVIVARNINIEADVSEVDAWLLAAQAINTCSDEGSVTPLELTSLICDKKLTVNGPVGTEDIHLFRTFGASNQHPGRAAEVFTFSPDAYLWFNAYFETTGRASTVYVKELPPRF